MRSLCFGLVSVFAFLMSVGCASLRDRTNIVTVVVKKNDTLNTIAREHGTTWQAIVQTNQQTLARGLYEGQELKIAESRAVATEIAVVAAAEGSQEENVDDEELDVLNRPNKGILIGPQSREPPSLIFPVEARISSHFGKRGRKFHKGFDLAANVGTPISAAGDGEVIYSGRQRGYGSTVVIDHGQFMTLYAHASKLYAKVGSKVRQGDLIAKVGRSGNARGVHLHFELRDVDNRPIDPEIYLHHKAIAKAGHSRMPAGAISSEGVHNKTSYTLKIPSKRPSKRSAKQSAKRSRRDV